MPCGYYPSTVNQGTMTTPDGGTLIYEERWQLADERDVGRNPRFPNMSLADIPPC
jgi:hypothetical protein